MIMTPKWLMPALTYLCFVGGQSPCSTPDGKRGDCRSILECPPLRAAASKPSMTPREVDILKRSACGFMGDIPKVCCAITTDTCITPEGNHGQCKSIFDCEYIAKMLQTPVVTAETKAYVNSIRCQSSEGFSVCCGPPPQTGPCQPSAAPPDPGTQCCGIDATSGNKIVGGTATSIDQYPWLAIIENKKGRNIKVLCGGALISARYVLTAAHCVVGGSTVGTPVNVRLGEYDISNPGRDCTQEPGGGEDCTEEPLVIAIERSVVHPGYNQSSPLRRNDIAMLRLKELAPYTDFIRPICLPTRDVTLNMPPTVRLYAAGWGPNNETHSKSEVKLHVDLPYKSIESCQPAYNVPRRRVPLWRGQLCAGGEKGKDTCKGDSGGPLMNPGTFFEVVGIVSFGAMPCGLEDIPGVYTKVYEYLPWIRSNIQP